MPRATQKVTILLPGMSNLSHGQAFGKSDFPEEIVCALCHHNPLPSTLLNPPSSPSIQIIDMFIGQCTVKEEKGRITPQVSDLTGMVW